MLKHIEGNDSTAILTQGTLSSFVPATDKIKFDKNYNLVSLAGTAFNFAFSATDFDFTEAQKGSTFTVVKHNAASNPLLFLPGLNVLSQSGIYQLNLDNDIVFEYIGFDGVNHKVKIYVVSNIDFNALIQLRELINEPNDILKGFLPQNYCNILCPQGFARSTAVGTQLNGERAFPFVLAQDITIDSLQIEVTTNVAAGLIRFCYRESAIQSNKYYPTSIVANSESEFATNTIGIKTNTPESPIILQRGKVYFQCHNSNSVTHVFRSATNSAIMRILGMGANAGATNLTNYTNWNAAQTYGPMPALYPGGASITNEQGAPMLGNRMA
jgi:hypothetical protein